MMNYKRRLFALLLCVLCLFTGCSETQKAPQIDKRSFLALDTAITLTCCGSSSTESADLIQQRLTDMEEELSRTIPSSDVSRLNQAGGESVPVSDELIALLNASIRCTEATNGYFDITIAPIADLWGFTKSSHTVPEPDEIAAALPYVGSKHIHTGTGVAQLDRHTQIDLGGIAKGYALEEILNICREQELTSALIDLGGDLLAYGRHPENRPWRVGIKDPDSTSNESASLGTLDIENRYLLTSGDYERFFTSDGKRYAHIIDPFTGYPAESDLHSVSIVLPLEAGDGILADALATALTAMGRDQAIEYWQGSTVPFEMILVDDVNTVTITPGLKSSFVPLRQEKYNYCYLP